jgi:hypothetical protein
VQRLKSSEQFWLVAENSSLFYNAFCYFIGIRIVFTDRVHPWPKIDYPILNYTIFNYEGSARLTGKSGGCGKFPDGAERRISPGK